MEPSTITAIQEALSPVAAKIGEGAEYTWEVLVWGQFAEGIAGMLAGASLVGVALWFAFICKKIISEGDNSYGPDPLVIFPSMGLVLCGLFGGTMLFSSVISVIAPEYAAIKMLLGLVSG